MFIWRLDKELSSDSEAGQTSALDGFAAVFSGKASSGKPTRSPQYLLVQFIVSGTWSKTPGLCGGRPCPPRSWHHHGGPLRRAAPHPGSGAPWIRCPLENSSSADIAFGLGASGKGKTPFPLLPYSRTPSPRIRPKWPWASPGYSFFMTCAFPRTIPFPALPAIPWKKPGRTTCPLPPESAARRRHQCPHRFQCRFPCQAILGRTRSQPPGTSRRTAPESGGNGGTNIRMTGRRSLPNWTRTPLLPQNSKRFTPRDSPERPSRMPSRNMKKLLSPRTARLTAT